MPEEPFIDRDDLLEKLYLDNLELSARVMTLGSLVSFLLDKNGISEDKHDSIIRKFDYENRYKLISEDPLLEDYWKKKVNDQLGDIPGIKF